MKKFFQNINKLHQFTMELEHHQADLHCEKCKKNNQFISHGYVYKKKNNGSKRIVGKRIFCSNRFGKSGCGCTLRLYLAEEIPRLQFNAIHFFIFLTDLFIGYSIQKAYKTACHACDPRNAYRWLRKLSLKIIDYRRALSRRLHATADVYQPNNKRLQLLLPTLQSLSLHWGDNPCVHYQLLQQEKFI